jgi:plastocyanin
MKKAVALSLASLGILILGGCSLSGSNTQTPSTSVPSPSTSQSSTPASMPASAPASAPVSVDQTNKTSVSISIQNFAFDPADLTISKGTAVTWTNNDSAPHQIKSTTFNSSSLGKGQTFSFTFNDAGTFDYSCAIHPSMLGKIVVK